MAHPFRVLVAIATALSALLAGASGASAKPEGTLTVAVATFGNERWLPHLYVGAEDVVLKPMFENLLSRDVKTGELTPMLAERWQVLDGGRTWKFHLRKGVRFHSGTELTAEDVRFTFATLAKEGSANSLAPEFRLIKSMEIEDPYTISVRFEKPLVVFGNKVTQGLFSSVAFIQSKKHVEAGEQGAERNPVATGPWKFVEHVRGDRIVYEAVENHWRVTPQWKRLVFVKVPEPATRMAMLRAGSVDVIEVGGEYVDELKKVGVRTLVMPNVSWVYIILGGQWSTKSTYDPKVPWAQPDAEKARKVRMALNLAVDKQAIMQRILGGLGTTVGSWLMYPNDPWASDALKQPYPYDPAKAKQLLAEAGYPGGFDVTMNLTAWPGRGYLPDVGEAVATYWERVGIRVKRRPVDRAVFAADFRARAYPGVALAYAAPLVAPEPWEVMFRAGYTKAALNLFIEHPKLDELIDRLSVQPNYQERVRIMRDELGPWLREFTPGVAIGAAHAIAGVGPKVGDWPLVPGHMGFHNWEYVTRK